MIMLGFGLLLQNFQNIRFRITKQIRDGRTFTTELAQEKCLKFQMDWDETVSVDSFSTIERILNCNLYLLNADALPVLNTTVTLFHSLMYKSEFQFNVPQCWLLFHDEHYDVITKPKGFLACKYFCQKCCSCVSHNNYFQNQKCNRIIKANTAKLSKVESGPIYKDAGHY